MTKGFYIASATGPCACLYIASHIGICSQEYRQENRGLYNQCYKYDQICIAKAKVTRTAVYVPSVKGRKRGVSIASTNARE